MVYTWFERSKTAHYFMQTKLSMSVTLMAPQVNLSLEMQPLQLFLTRDTWRASSSHTFHCVTNPQTVEIEVAQISQVREAEVKQISLGLTLYLTSSEGISLPIICPTSGGPACGTLAACEKQMRLLGLPFNSTHFGMKKVRTCH